jgi:hypothetical protein
MHPRPGRLSIGRLSAMRHLRDQFIAKCPAEFLPVTIPRALEINFCGLAKHVS